MQESKNKVQKAAVQIEKQNNDNGFYDIRTDHDTTSVMSPLKSKKIIVKQYNDPEMKMISTNSSRKIQMNK